MPPEGLFFHDPRTGFTTADALLQAGFGQAVEFRPVLQTEDPALVFQSLLQAFYFEKDLVLLDADFSREELTDFLGEDLPRLNRTETLRQSAPCPSMERLIEKVTQSRTGTLSLFTSGTTGRPKQISHGFTSLVKGVKQSPERRADIWGLAYNPTHMAGIQVFFQAFLNRNPLINLFGGSRECILNSLENFSITHLSATPTFYRLLFPFEKAFPLVKQVSLGGERFDPHLQETLRQGFPQARIKNIYATTEAGSLLASDGEVFTLRPGREDQVKVEAGELWIRQSELGQFGFTEAWYPTGDLVEVVQQDPLQFRFLQRRNEEINVGGYKVNPQEVEAHLRAHDSIREARVTGMPNAVLGRLLAAEVVAAREEEPPSERELRAFLEERLQPYKIPRIFRFVDSIPKTRSGKLQR